MKLLKDKFKEQRIKPLNELRGNKIETKRDDDDEIVRNARNKREI